MVKRKSPKARELPLFDLPLHANDEETGSGQGPTELDNAGDLPLDLEEPELTLPEPAAPEPAAPEPEPAAPEPEESEPEETEPEESEPVIPELLAPEPSPPPTIFPPPASSGDDDESSPVVAPVPEPDMAPPATLKDRLLAGLLDLGIQLLVVVGAVVAAQAMGLVLGLDDWIPFALLGLDFSFLYWFIPLAFWGQTPGMAWVGHSAVGADDEPLTFGQTALRWIGAVVTLALAGLPLLLAIGGRSLTDRLSDTKTVVI